jgi:hypothetical protein
VPTGHQGGPTGKGILVERERERERERVRERESEQIHLYVHQRMSLHGLSCPISSPFSTPSFLLAWLATITPFLLSQPPKLAPVTPLWANYVRRLLSYRWQISVLTAFLCSLTRQITPSFLKLFVSLL